MEKGAVIIPKGDVNMKIVSYRPNDDQFWIGCTKDEAEKFFVPLLDEQRKAFLPEFFTRMQDYCSDRYKELVCKTMGVDEMSFIYFNVSRDLKECYYSVPHHPFHNLWNGHGPFVRCDTVEIKDLSELKDIKPTYKGVLLSSLSESQMSWIR